MSLITWDEKYSVGIEEIDEQHKKLIRLTNGLYDAMKSGRGHESLQILLEELLEYTRYHFTIEEDLFQKCSYAASELHMYQHQEFKNKIILLNVNIRKGKGVLTVAVFQMLKDWINHHILYMDKLYVNEVTAYLAKEEDQNPMEL